MEQNNIPYNNNNHDASVGMSKKADTEVKPDDVTISIASPASKQIFHKGDTVKVNADVAYTEQLHGYIVTITNTANGVVVFETEGHSHSDHMAINETWVDTLNTSTELELTVTAVIDHDENLKNAKLIFNCQP